MCLRIRAPRTACCRIVLPMDLKPAGEPSIAYLKGSVLVPRAKGARVIGHVVNNRTVNWGGRGVAMALRKKWPQAQEDFRTWGRSRRLSRALGEVCMSQVEPDLTIANMVAQVGYGEASKPRIRYAALKSCLAEVSLYASDRRATLHIPRIGCGQAGGSWDVVRDLILSTASAAECPLRCTTPQSRSLPSRPKPHSPSSPL